jgi:hypothetical protein
VKTEGRPPHPRAAGGPDTHLAARPLGAPAYAEVVVAADSSFLIRMR